MHYKPFAGATDRNVVEQTCRQQRLECCIAGGVVVSPVGGRMKIRAHRVGVDTAIALHGDSGARLRVGFACSRCSFSRNARCGNQPERGYQ